GGTSMTNPLQFATPDDHTDRSIMTLLDSIINRGNRSIRPGVRGNNRVVCRDGFRMSVIAGAGTDCTPRPDWPAVAGEVPADYPGPYTHVEVGYPSARPEPWDQWARYADDPEDPTDTVYGYVP